MVETGCAAGNQHGNLEAQCWTLIPDILAQSCWGTLLTGQRLWQSEPAAGATSCDSKCNLTSKPFSSHKAKEGRGTISLCCVSHHARSIKWGNKKSWEAFSVKMKPFLQRHCFYELHGTFDSKKHFSRGKGPDWSGKRNWECLNLSSIFILNCQGRKGGLSNTVLVIPVTPGNPTVWPGERISLL